ncbi:hypothetical protein ATSB10_26090 [Dyella thiooxydans]|uniref:Uncharacterized protein n=1 Tax=Dyella thiooxydans TaxID=445710 RepID=A0A160N2E0_9GAMM|nr:hypothetical protein [Dyella thiooxydans]AND70063.1 hypothetical protein ATSB10_26090 [Dyella thiooxydans]
MRRLFAVSLTALLASACSPSTPPPPTATGTPPPSAPTDATLGSPAWYDWVDRSLGISSDGHGPDHGSPEWNQAVQRKLGQEAPQATPGSPQWQQSVDALLRTRGNPPSSD